MSASHPDWSPEEGSRVQDLARMLRGIGAAVLLAAASTFLIQHWADAGDLPRYFGLLGLTVMLAAAGLLVGVGMRESRSARTFLALACATAPAHFAIVGGLIYSQWASPGSGLPTAQYAIWQAPSPSAALAVAAISFAVLAPIALLSFSALARSRARSACAVFLACGAAMWVPLRDPLWVTLVVGAQFLGLAIFELRALRNARGLRTAEGVIVRVLLAATPALTALRSLLHYDFTWFLVSILGAGAAAGAAAIAVERNTSPHWRVVSEAAAIVASIVTWLAFAAGIGSEAALSYSGRMLLVMLPFAASVAALGAIVEARRRTYYRGAAWIALATVAFDLAAFRGEFSALVALGVGIATLAGGHLLRERVLFTVGAATAAVALVIQVLEAAHHFAWSGWGALAILGIAGSVSAAVRERHHAALRERARDWGSRLGSWEY